VKNKAKKYHLSKKNKQLPYSLNINLKAQQSLRNIGLNKGISKRQCGKLKLRRIPILIAMDIPKSKSHQLLHKLSIIKSKPLLNSNKNLDSTLNIQSKSSKRNRESQEVKRKKMSKKNTKNCWGKLLMPVKNKRLLLNILQRRNKSM
jgi:hypothetical protein